MALFSCVAVKRLTELNIDSLGLKRLRGHKALCRPTSSCADARKHFYSLCGSCPRRWNNLPAHPEEFSSLAAFKRLLHSSNLNRFTLYRSHPYFLLSASDEGL